MGLIKEITICQNCQLKTYLFKSYFFVTFDLEKILKKNVELKELNLDDSFAFYNKDVQENEKYCNKCLTKGHIIAVNFFIQFLIY